MDIPKEIIYHAHSYETKYSKYCTLILAVGNYSTTFVLCGLNTIGRLFNGVLSIKGECLDICNATMSDMADNREICAIMKSIGFDQDRLHYGGIVILADQFIDAYRIKKLIMNYIHYFCPGSSMNEDFVQLFIPDTLRATNYRNKKVVRFTSLEEFEAWLKENNNGKGWYINYGKNISSFTAGEARASFIDFPDKCI